jgi:hypothetical protein
MGYSYIWIVLFVFFTLDIIQDLKINNVLVKLLLYLTMLLTLTGFYVPARSPRSDACENT